MIFLTGFLLRCNLFQSWERDLGLFPRTYTEKTQKLLGRGGGATGVLGAFPKPFDHKTCKGAEGYIGRSIFNSFYRKCSFPLSVYDKAGTRYLHKAYPPKMSHR